MKYFIFTLLMFPFFLSAQSKGDWLVGATVTNISLQNLQVSPNVSYMITDYAQVGGAVSYASTTNYQYSLINLFGRYYSNKNIGSARLFGELNGGVSASDGSFNYGVGVGILSFLTKKVYISPRVEFSNFYDQAGEKAASRVLTDISIGLRF